MSQTPPVIKGPWRTSIASALISNPKYVNKCTPHESLHSTRAYPRRRKLRYTKARSVWWIRTWRAVPPTATFSLHRSFSILCSTLSAPAPEACAVARVNAESGGAILADEMGLGKTLTTIALCWTLLKQGPRGRAQHSAPAFVTKIIICVPSSLLHSWGREFTKWLGIERIRPTVCDQKGSDAKELCSVFVHIASPVLIISYDMMRKHESVLFGAQRKSNNKLLLVCDEAHRLKASAGNKTIDALKQCKTAMKLLLTGTPLQNNLSELFVVRPCVTGCTVICVLRCISATHREPAWCQHSAQALSCACISTNEKLMMLFLRRTMQSTMLTMPPKLERTIFLRFPLQLAMYRVLLQLHISQAAQHSPGPTRCSS